MRLPCWEKERPIYLFSRSEAASMLTAVLYWNLCVWHESAREHLHRSLPFMLTSAPNLDIWTYPLEIAALAPIQFICRSAKKLQSQSSLNFFCFPRGSGDSDFLLDYSKSCKLIKSFVARFLSQKCARSHKNRQMRKKQHAGRKPIWCCKGMLWILI